MKRVLIYQIAALGILVIPSVANAGIVEFSDFNTIGPVLFLKPPGAAAGTSGLYTASSTEVASLSGGTIYLPPGDPNFCSNSEEHNASGEYDWQFFGGWPFQWQSGYIELSQQHNDLPQFFVGVA